MRPQSVSLRQSAFVQNACTQIRPPRCMQRIRKSLRVSSVSAESPVATSLFFVAQNNFKVKPENAQDFEEVWKNRDSKLLETPGFIRFALLRGDEEGEYISESVWQSRKDFDAWRDSQKFQQAHGGEGKPKDSGAPKTGDMMLGRPVAKFYEAVTTTEQTLF
ncbi:hypothetical protein CVIRNUC_002565 [Coccomyxa viridis]|uniref:ABM domain-containing protein n=1 Tax=Coccomyxa viridis TaxID=1274662 RepID=A0AAV1HWV5_9CHLO|nr:hypothetical protein CVIRNUC_002565 [Coccomyxa viridis]